MSKVTCCDCGRLQDARSMQTCRECYSYLCPDCAKTNSGCCSQCTDSSIEEF
ncbi:MAG TPA: hypothetical protein PLZ84_02875 [Clostridia bacterium]|nr:hypothetical protein [Clostridia bacterium]